MALQYNAKTTQIGAAFKKAYARIQDFRGDSTHISITVATYADAKARKESQPVDHKVFTYPYDGTQAVLTYGYTRLKKEPEFEDSLDV